MLIAIEIVLLLFILCGISGIVGYSLGKSEVKYLRRGYEERIEILKSQVTDLTLENERLRSTQQLPDGGPRKGTAERR